MQVLKKGPKYIESDMSILKPYNHIALTSMDEFEVLGKLNSLDTHIQRAWSRYKNLKKKGPKYEFQKDKLLDWLNQAEDVKADLQKRYNWLTEEEKITITYKQRFKKWHYHRKGPQTGKKWYKKRVWKTVTRTYKRRVR